MAAPTVAAAAAVANPLAEFKAGPIQCNSPNGFDEALDSWVETKCKLVVALEAARGVVISTTSRILQLLPNCQPLSFPRPP